MPLSALTPLWAEHRDYMGEAQEEEAEILKLKETGAATVKIETVLSKGNKLRKSRFYYENSMTGKTVWDFRARILLFSL